MNLTLLLGLALAAIVIVAVVVVVSALSNAPEGYEDDLGFHSRSISAEGESAGGASKHVGGEAVPLIGSAAREPTTRGKVAGGMVPAS